jgi:hypothetical protein
MRRTAKSKVKGDSRHLLTKTHKYKGGSGNSSGNNSSKGNNAYAGPCGPLEDYKPNVHTVDEDNCMGKLHFHKKKMLGCGGQGCAYSVKEDSEAVVKVTKLKTRLAKHKWYNEACFSRILGDVKPALAPKIHAFYECELNGYIHMQKLTTIDTIHIDGKDVVIREHDAEANPVDHIMLIPVAIQNGYADKLAQLIGLGYIHMDNHVGNLGLIKGKPILFDFGFVQKRTFVNKADRDWALAFSLFIMIEHCPLDEIEKTTIFSKITRIMNAGAPLTMEQMAKKYPSNPVKTVTAIVATAKELSKTNTDLYAGCIMFASIISLEQTERYAHPLYEKIYDVRQGNTNSWLK